MRKTPGRLRLCICLLILLLVFIWGNSLMPGQASGTISQWVKDTLFPGMPGNPHTGNDLLRKLAHFSEFGCLGMCLLWLTSMLRKKIWLPFVCAFASACVDETIQCFVPERGPSFRDVAIDTAGAACGIGLLLLGYTIYKKKRKSYLGGSMQ